MDKRLYLDMFLSCNGVFNHDEGGLIDVSDEAEEIVDDGRDSSDDKKWEEEKNY